METTMRIGELAQATDVEVDTIRYYEKIGLLPGPARSTNGYRAYGPEHARQLTFIRHCRSLDMALDEIRLLLQFKSAPEDDCHGVNELLEEHIAHVSTRIKELRALEKQLRELRAQCASTRQVSECAILNELATPVPAASQRGEGGHVRASAAVHKRGKQAARS